MYKILLIFLTHLNAERMIFFPLFFLKTPSVSGLLHGESWIGNFLLSTVVRFGP